MNVTVAEIAAFVDGEVLGDGSVRLTGFNGIREAQSGELTFIADTRYQKYVETTQASAIIAPFELPGATVPVLVVAEPYDAMLRALARFSPSLPSGPQDIHATAVIAPDARLGDNVAVGPHAVIEQGVVLGAGVKVGAGSFVGAGAQIGAGTVIHPNVTIYGMVQIGERCVVHSGTVVGSDGFGYAEQGGARVKIPQLGRVLIGDDVELGSNVSIDRATFGTTRIGNGVKIDNLVQIGHNVAVGDHSVICALAGVAGSTVIGKRVLIGGCVGINGHISVGDGAMIGGNSGVVSSVKPGEIVFGYPAVDIKLSHRITAAQRRLPEMLKRIRTLERQLGDSADAES